MNLYFQFLQTVAAFIVQAIKIDGNKDGKISGAEIRVFFFATLLPLITSANSIKDQWQAFYDKVKGMTLVEFKQVLVDIVVGDLLPSELDGVEEKVDLVADAIFQLIDSIQGVLYAYNEIFGKRVLEIRLVDKPTLKKGKR
ncbi:MAG: hypothetical protein Unbinned5350contig1001_9 [Prokaryotic dsDNA virus sp.]|nr:MAG: hypothetical protein Unbinned5350contig1001_9 [Prokaryotic dsDNA virus sp.]|tara:strand:- start:30700 stop:31122 length:423 start_codon:yes stop_codon:yes gene_type:complete